jgi:transcriptional regulator with XRE-family HTH domain
MEIRTDFGLRVKELRARSGISQEVLAYRSGLDRSYIGGVERGQRNISLDNIQKIAEALNVTIEYMFSQERFSTNPAYLKKDFQKPFSERFKYQLDRDKKLLAFQVSGVLSGQDVDRMVSTLLGACSTFSEGELNLLIDHREMKAADGEAVVYSPEMFEKAIQFQEKMYAYSNKVVVLCNSQFMVNQMNHVTKISGLFDKSDHLYGNDKEVIGEAYELLDIHGHELIRA